MDEMRDRRQTWLICLGLALGVLAAYAPLWQCGFIAYDDPDYVTANAVVKQGVSWAGVGWAFTTDCASNWHPLTWLSHIVDYQLYGMNPTGHHLTSLLLHVANSILLYLLLQRMTKARWPSALAAALFALHPMHVESVAWVAERKDVLSTLFWMLTVWAYVRYVEECKMQPPSPRLWRPGNAKCKKFYALAVVFFALALMAKPMVVTLPFVLLLLDYWPLQRLRPPAARLLAEKAPFFILAAAACVVTFLVQQHAGAVSSLDRVPVGVRLANIPVAYVRYLGKTFWPVDLALLYPYRIHRPVWEVGCAVALLAGVTGWVVWRSRTQRYWAAAWLWFLGMLAPVIGLVQIGTQSMADRYDYLPSVGLFIMIIWGAREWLARASPGAPAVLGGLAVAGCLAVTPGQVRYWKDSETLFRHAVETTEGNGVMESNLGKVLCQENRVEEALPYLQRAVVSAPDLPKAHYNLGAALLAKGRVEEALAQFETHVKLQPDDPIAQFNLGSVQLEHGRAAAAVAHLRKAVELAPRAAEGHCKLGIALARTGRAAEAISQYENALRIAPDYIQARHDLAWILATAPEAALRNGPRAVELALRANELTGGQSPGILGTLAAAYAESGKFADAIATAQRALELAGGQGNAAVAGVLRSQLALYREGSPVRDPSLAGGNAAPRSP
jgi:tetratricopeptide (TPR) repeat protein